MRRASAGARKPLLQDDESEDDESSSRSLSGPSDNVPDNKYGAAGRASSSGSRTAAVASADRGEETTGSRSDVNDIETAAAAAYHSIGTLDDSVNLPEYVREHNTTLTFPEKLMLTLTHVERECAKSGKPESGASIGWILDGKAFVVRNKEQLCATWLPLFFGQSKFSSFTRKLYRWGFRKINMAPHSVGGLPANAYFFGNENFQRDKKDMLTQMKSVTAAKTRCELAADAAKHAWVPPNQGSNVSGAAQLVPQGMFQAANQIQCLNGVQPQLSMPGGTGVAAVDQAALIQQAVNLAALQSLLAAPQVGLQQTQASIEAPQGLLPNQFLDNGVRPLTIPSQGPQAPPFDYQQMLRQFTFSAALVAATGAMNQAQPTQQASQPQTQAPAQPQAQAPVPWWVNAAVQASVPQPLQAWRPIPEPVALPVIPNDADQERLRGVIDMFLRYGQAAQQQQQQNQPSPQNPPPPPPDHDPPY